MNSTSVKSGIMKVSIIGLSIMVVCLVSYYIIEVKHQKTIEQIAQHDRSTLASKIVDIYSQQYSNIVRDNSAWDEFITSFKYQKDEDWLRDNIGYMIENYNADNVCVFDSVGNIAYQQFKQDAQNIDFYNFDGKSIPEILNGESFTDFFCKINNVIYEYHGAAIMSAAQMQTRNEKPSGYLFLIKKISYEVLTEYQLAIGNAYSVGIANNNSEIQSVIDAIAPDYLVTKQLNNYNNQPTAYIYFAFKNSIVVIFKKFIIIFSIVAFLCILIFLAIVRYTQTKISRPLQKIAESFNSGKTDKILPLKKESNEFGIISGMMEEFFEQKDNLASLNANLKQSQEEIMAQNEALHQQKEEITTQHENLLLLNEQLSTANTDLSIQKSQLEKTNKLLTSSITYASRLQSAMLQAVEPNNSILKKYFVTYYPKDIVGGDFYLTRQVGNTLIICVGDCTGHGVPGAVLASMGISFLTQIVASTNENDLASNIILNRLKIKVTAALGLDQEGEQRTDGMDVALLVYNKITRKAQFSGAHRPIVIIRNNQLNTIKGDHIPIGHFVKKSNFTPIDLNLEQGDKIYLYSDGCTDQTGGPNNRRIMAHSFKEHLLEYSVLPFEQQKTEIENFIFTWQGNNAQTDDIALLGFEVE